MSPHPLRFATQGAIIAAVLLAAPLQAATTAASTSPPAKPTPEQALATIAAKLALRPTVLAALLAGKPAPALTKAQLAQPPGAAVDCGRPSDAAPATPSTAVNLPGQLPAPPPRPAAALIGRVARHGAAGLTQAPGQLPMSNVATKLLAAVPSKPVAVKTP